jgi:hypothetical protein
MMRKAVCCCGRLTISVRGEPEIHGICHCDDCRKKTGSAFGWSAYFPDECVVERQGEAACYEIAGDHPQKRYFCRSCGSTLYWKTTTNPGLTGVAGGNFVETPLAEPTLSLRSAKRRSWVVIPADWHSL